MSEEKEQESQIPGVEAETAPELIGRYEDASGNVRPELWRCGVDDLNKLNIAGGFAWQVAGPSPMNNIATADSRTYQGVAPVGGEVTDIAIDASGGSDLVLYAATNNGGIWKTSDGGATWGPTSDGLPSLSMGAVAIDPGNPSVVYAGSGNLFDGSGGFIKASGLYKSVDGATTWSVADGGVFGSTFAGTGINRIVCPAADSLLVGTQNGLFRSIDGGLNFGANTPGFDDGKPIMKGFVTGLAMDTANAGTAWVAIRGLDENGDPFAGGGLFRLALNPDGSVTPSANLLNNLGGIAGVRFGSIVFAQSTRDPGGNPNSSILYAVVQDQPKGAKPFLVGLYRSTNAGTNWTNLPNLNAGMQAAGAQGEDDQSNYDFTLGVDPQNADLLYAGFKRVWNSQNATTAATGFSPCSQGQVHWDQHELVFSPQSHWGAGPPTIVYTGSDGGVARSNDGGNTWTQLNAGTGTHLFYGIDIGRGAGNNQFTYGGAQDNGTPGHRKTDAGTTWLAGIDGDGGVPAVDPADPTIVYGFDNSFLIKTSDGGNNWALSSPKSGIPITGATNAAPIVITSNGHLFQDDDVVTVSGVQGNTAANGSWPVKVVDANNFRLIGTTGNGNYTANTGFVTGTRVGRGLQNPSDSFFRRVALVPNGNNPATTVYVAEKSSVRRSTDAGAKFDEKEVKNFNGLVSSIVCLDVNRIWVGTGDGQVHFSSDAGSSWKDFSPGGSGPVTGIAVDPADNSRVVAVYAGFSGISSRFRTQHCFLTTNSGNDWADISGMDGVDTGNLPDLPLHSVVFDDSTSPSTIIVASDAAVLRSVNNGVSWERLGTGLPQATCRSIAIDTTDKTRTPRLLRVGTYGRSCFELVRQSGPRLSVEANLGFGAVLKGKSATLRVRVLNVGDAAVNLTSFGRTAGDPDFDLASPPTLTPIAPGEIRGFDIRFTADGNDKQIRSATFTLQSNDAGQPTRLIQASGITFTSGKPRLAVNACLNFGEVERGANRVIPFTVTNKGLADLVITQFALSGGDFTVPAPALPLTIAASDQQSFNATFAPGTWGGSSTGTLHIASNDPRTPSLDLPLAGRSPFNYVLLIACIALGAAVIVGGVAVYEDALKH